MKTKTRIDLPRFLFGSLFNKVQSTKRWVVKDILCHVNRLVFSNKSKRICSPETSIRILICLVLVGLGK
jgi:hypothetical protein